MDHTPETHTMAYMLFEGPGFQMEVPTDWLVTSSPQYQARFVARKTADGYPNLFVTVAPVNDDVDAARVAANALEAQQQNYPAYTLVAEQAYDLPGGGGGVLRRFTWREPQRNVDVVQLQAFFIFAGLLYTLTATRTANDPATLDEAFEHMIGTFAFTQPL